MTAQPIRYSADLETVRDKEPETISGLIEQFDTILETTARITGTRFAPSTRKRMASSKRRWW